MRRRFRASTAPAVRVDEEQPDAEMRVADELPRGTLLVQLEPVRADRKAVERHVEGPVARGERTGQQQHRGEDRDPHHGTEAGPSRGRPGTNAGVRAMYAA